MKTKLPEAQAQDSPETTLPMPTGGGVYIRLPDGSLQRQDEIPETSETVEQLLKDD